MIHPSSAVALGAGVFLSGGHDVAGFGDGVGGRWGGGGGDVVVEGGDFWEVSGVREGGRDVMVMVGTKRL